MCPRPQAGSRQVMEASDCLETITCSISARVAQGGVGKSSRLFFSSALWAITACDVFRIAKSLGRLSRLSFYIRSDSHGFVKGGFSMVSQWLPIIPHRVL